MMTVALLLYTGVFVLYGVMEVMGLMPQELVSAGLTLPRLFSKYLGDPVSTSTNEYIDLYNLMSHPTPCLLYTSPSPRDATLSRMPSSA